ncbi:UDP-N-acetylmuramate dehydrogenase [Segniliparus rugosus]|uniref:UDP-N-acetylenolpyruvoylglucosamine reductase n=1 Tax=Segniliparus rugosus (strain ATCC BAA-974 / DSM 45345 / CCUG 50838 / CIP 108380 / JCM 13579 / CDC 945) TaxID=679197 RepID=E5XTD9_SEGRC|nr:UDP-N-acetylmuramate dehydrogenase [Segniliparus rugosus]EFV12401.1 UDP-N-acetylenolpyruvoylglucosamine reductase [Segniliparus rugosus ATCC BAA-974]
MESAQLPRKLADLGALTRKDATFAQLTTLRVGGSIGLLVDCPDREIVFGAVKELADAQVPTIHLGGGSNLVAPDEGWPGAVLRVTSEGLSSALDSDGALVLADAGVRWDDLVAFAVESGLGGLECLSGIPGNVGASVKQNIGAYGSQLSDCLVEAELWNWSTGEHRWASAESLRLGYRSSAIRHEECVVVLTLRLRLTSDGLSAPIRYRELASAVGVREGERAPAREVRDAVLSLRAGKGMLLDEGDHDTWSTGSFFVNPVLPLDEAERLFPRAKRPERMPWFVEGEQVKLSAAWLIEHAGFGKGFPGEDAPARLSVKHTLAITNRGAATSADVLTLAGRVRAGVREAFGVRLEPEPIILGKGLD